MDSVVNSENIIHSGKKLSVVIPAFNEEGMIMRTADVISQILNNHNIPYEIIFVDDGSTDRTWDIIQEIASSTIRGVSFSRNFGKESAMMAGLSESIGDCCAVIDCDLQHPPEKLVEMYQLWLEGYEVVEAVKSNRGKESFFHKIAAKTFYAIVSHATKMDMSRASDFKLLDRRAVNVLLKMNEAHAFFRALSSWIGFNTAKVEFDVQEREVGTTKWSSHALIRYAVSNIASFSSAPMQIVTFLGVLMLITAIVFGMISLVQKATGTAVAGFTTVILLLLFIGSIIMISLGIIGYYIACIYDEVKDRPRYIISKSCGGEG